MPQKNADKKSDWNIRPYLAIGLIFFIVFCCCIAVVCVVFKFSALREAFSGFVSIAEPIVYGLVIGYLINPIMVFIERHLWRFLEKKGGKKKWKRLVRTISSILSLLLFLMIIALLLYMVIPEVVNSVMRLVETLPGQINSFINSMNSWKFGDKEIIEQVENYLMLATDYLEDWLKNSLLPQTKDYIASITNGVINVLVAVKNIVIGLIVSIYVMCEKESFEGQAKKIIFAFLPPKAGNQIIQVFHTTNEIFGGFIKGKLLDSLIIGIICYIVLAIIHMPYTLLVSVIVGVTNVIPFFGPFIGAIPCTFLILLADPLYALYFVIFIIVLQQVDGNIIGPKILGNSTGLSSFWVMFAIIVGSGVFGVAGMFFGCPVFAVIYYIIQKTVHYLLGRKSLPLETEVYVHATGVEAGRGELRYGRYADEPAPKKEEKSAAGCDSE